MKEFHLTIDELEADIKNGKSYLLVEPVHDSRMKLLIGTLKILTEKDVKKLREIYVGHPNKIIRVHTTIPHYVEEEKRVSWVNSIISFFEKSPLFKNLSRERKEFIVKYLKAVIREDDYVIWKVSQLKKFSDRVFEHTLNTCFIALAIYYSYTLSNHSGMIDGKAVENIINASLLHSIGIMKINPDFLKRKRWEICVEKNIEFFNHPVEAFKTIQSEASRHDLSDDVLQAILDHEEFVDGTGMPRGILGTDMPFLAKLLSISHYFELLLGGELSIRERSYKECFHKIVQEKGKFDPALIEALKSSFIYLA